MEIKTSAYCFCLSLEIPFFTTVILGCDGISFGENSTFYLDSKGEIFGYYDGKNKDVFVERFKTFFNDLDKYYWVAGIYDCEVCQIFIAESEDSDTIFAYGVDFDVSDMSVSDLKNRLSMWEKE